MNTLKHTVIKYLLILPLALCYQSLLADELPEDENTYLNVARSDLNIAFDNYNKGDITASKQNLKHASEWLYRAINHSHSDKVKVEAQKLATDIDGFRLTLNKSTENNELARFWHQTTSLIKRESEHLIHNYTESLTNNVILRHLLDAKMHFYTAEHDLFISHDSSDAKLELHKSLEYLSQAEQISKPELNTYINNLSTNINELISLLGTNKNAWKKDKLIHSLDNAVINLNQADSIASPSTKLRLTLITEDIAKLKFDIQKTNLKLIYNSIMADFGRAIKNI